MSDLQDLLDARGNRHGDFTEMSSFIKNIDAAMKGIRYQSLPAYQQHALDLFAVKIGRILAGDNNYDDHWRDIAGYATRVMESLPKDPKDHAAPT